MRTNAPVGDDFAVTQLLDEASEAEKVSAEALELAKIGKSPSWKIISDYLDTRIAVYQKGLFGEDLAKVDTAIIGQRFLAAQSVINEFEALQNEINTVTKAVDDAKKA